jgi:uncharacterized surface protein with fasciclin (FAS1) repeats
MKKTIRQRIYILSLIISFNSCIPPVEGPPPDPRSFDPPDTDLLDVGYALPILNDFMYVMQKTHLTDLLEDEGPYTVFAPIQISFEKFRIENRLINIDQYPEDDMRKILRYHVLPGRWSVFDMPSGYYETMLHEKTTGNPIDLYIEDDYIFWINGLNIIFDADLPSANGFIHAVKAVLKITTMLDQLSVNKDFTLISEIMNRKDIDPELKALLTDDVPDTFFAPTDKAILSFLDNNPAWSTIEDIPAESLNEIIRNHLLSNENIVMDGIKEDLMLTLSNGNTIVVKIEYPKWLIMQENRTIASINVKDIQGVNGVVHQVDRVLIP